MVVAMTLSDTLKVSTQRRTYFSRSPHDIWSAVNGGTTYPPCAIPADSTNLDIPVGFHLNPQQALESGKGWTLEARLQSSPGSSGASSIPFISFSGTWDDSTREVTANLVTPKYNDGSTRPLPWSFRGQLIWTIANETGEAVDKGTLALELYVLSAHIPKYMKAGGIPLDLLRLPTLIPAWMMIEKDPNLVLGWSSFVTHALFNDNRLWYDIWKGQSTYCGVNWEGTSSSSKIVLWIDLWLSDMNGIMKRGSMSEKYAVNCHDTANLTAAIASLGLPDKDTLLYSCLVDDFGFIKETFLIGRHSKPEAVNYTGADKCNNPFYGKANFNKKMKCQPKELNRSAFDEHKFVVQAEGLVAKEPSPGDPVVGLLINPRVLDSCTGPHLGAEELGEYIKNAVDTVIPANSSSKLATVEDINRDPDIYALAPRPAMIRAVKSQALPESLYKSMNDLFSEVPYQIMEPCEGFTDPHSESMIVTWTVIKNDAVDIDGNRGELHINISRFYTQEDVQAAYDRRRGMFKNGTYKEDSTNPKNGLNFIQKSGPGFHTPRCSLWRPKHRRIYYHAFSCYTGGRRKDTVHAIRLESRWRLLCPSRSYRCISNIQTENSSKS